MYKNRSFFCLAKPQHPNAIEYFVHVGNLLQSVENDINSDENTDFHQLNEALGIGKCDLSRFNKKTATATARNLIKIKYSNPPLHFRLCDADQNVVNMIISMLNFLHF